MSTNGGLILALRRFRRRPAFFFFAVSTLALGIGAATMAFSVVDTALLQAVPYPGGARLVWIGESGADGVESGVSLPALARWRESSRTLIAVAAFTVRNSVLAEGNGSQQVRTALVSADFFSVLRVPPLVGRSFLPEEDQRFAAPVAIISYDLWQRKFAGQADALDATVLLDEVPHRIVGIMPKGFSYPDARTEAWTPVMQGLGEFATADGVGVVSAIGRLRRNADASAATAELRRIEERYGAAQRDDLRDRPYATLLRDRVIADVLPRLRVLVGAAILVLALAFANVANMLLAQLIRRRQELAVRIAIGASWSRLAGTLTVECALIAAGGVLGGLMVGWAVLSFAAQFASPELAELINATINVRSVLFAFAAAAIAAVCVGIAGFVQGSSTNVLGALRGAGGHHSAGRVGSRVRDAIVVFEVAITLALLTGAGVLAKSFFGLAHRDLGIDSQHVYVASLSRPYTVLTSAISDQTRTFMRSFLRNVASAPGISSAAISSSSPADGYSMMSTASVEGLDEPGPVVGVTSVSPDYFRVLRIPLRRGRLFSEGDGTGYASVAIIDQQLAHRVFGRVDPVGRVITLDGMALRVRVVGVAGNVRPSGATERSLPQVYLPYPALPLPWVSVVVRSETDPGSVLAALQQAVAPLDPQQPVADFQSLRARLADNIDRSEFYAILLAAFAATALVLTGTGLYGVIALLVARGMHEMGIRASLGASPVTLFSLVMRRACMRAAIGVTIGMGFVLASTRGLSSLLFGVSPLDGWIIAISIAAIAVLAILFTCVPALRAARVDPARLVRFEG